MTEYQKMVSGLLYNPSNPEIEKLHIKGLTNCEKFNKIPQRKVKKKQKALKRLIPSSDGNEMTILTPFYCEYGINIKVGKGCFCNYNCTMLDVAPITLEQGVWIGANVNIVTPMHPMDADERYFAHYPDGFHDLEYAKPITIKSKAWICSGVTVCGGVTIGENSIVAAGSVVTRDMPPNSLVGGVPAKVIRALDEKDRIDVWNTYINEKVPKSERKKTKEAK